MERMRQREDGRKTELGFKYFIITHVADLLRDRNVERRER